MVHIVEFISSSVFANVSLQVELELPSDIHQLDIPLLASMLTCVNEALLRQASLDIVIVGPVTVMELEEVLNPYFGRLRRLDRFHIRRYRA